MTTIQHPMQADSARIAAFLAKLADSSAAAVAVRDRVLSALKAELDRQFEFEEQCAFPVLRRQETKDLVTRALNDTRQMREILAELERIPQASESFAAKLSELQKLLQHHLRNHRSEVLPRVMNALSDEETSVIVAEVSGWTAGAKLARGPDLTGGRSEGEHENARTTEPTLAIVGPDPVRQDTEVARMTEEASADTTSGGASRMALVSDQPWQAMQITMAVECTRTLAEIAQMQCTLIAGSLHGMRQFNACYVAFIRSWSDLLLFRFLPR